MPWMKQCCLWGERKVSLFYTLSTGPHQFPSPFQQKWKNEDVKNRGDQRQEQEKVNKFNPILHRLGQIDTTKNILIKVKEWGREKQRSPTPEAKKSKQS